MITQILSPLVPQGVSSSTRPYDGAKGGQEELEKPWGKRGRARLTNEELHWRRPTKKDGSRIRKVACQQAHATKYVSTVNTTTAILI